MQIDGGTHILRKDLVKILKDVLGREPAKIEFDVFFTYEPPRGLLSEGTYS
jgi:hypothetical protein